MLSPWFQRTLQPRPLGCPKEKVTVGLWGVCALLSSASFSSPSSTCLSPGPDGTTVGLEQSFPILTLFFFALQQRTWTAWTWCCRCIWLLWPCRNPCRQIAGRSQAPGLQRWENLSQIEDGHHCLVYKLNKWNHQFVCNRDGRGAGVWMWKGPLISSCPGHYYQCC